MNVEDRSQLPSTIYTAGELTTSTRFPVWGNCNSWFWSWTMSSAHLLKLSFIPSRLSDFSPFSCLYFHCLSGQQLTWLGTWTVRLVLNPSSSVAQPCPILSDPMDCSTPGLPVHHQLLLELTQTHVHRVGDAIQTSHPLSSPSPPAFNLSQHQGLFQRISTLTITVY